MKVEFFIKYIPIMLQATKHTINLAVISLGISLILAIIIASIIYYKIRFITPVLKLYVSYFRGTPALCQLYLIYFGLGATDIPILANMTAYGASIVALSLNMSAYMAENLRGALSSVDKGQYEAGLSIGLSNFKIFSHIVFPFFQSFHHLNKNKQKKTVSYNTLSVNSQYINVTILLPYYFF